jgi:adenylate kinase family enzyme
MPAFKFPKIIILYGPPAAGKGTQAHFLKQVLPDYHHLDFGSELRAFVKENLGDIKNLEEQIQTNSDPKNLEIARRIKSDMKNSLPVQTPDLRFVIEKTINDCVNREQGMIIEGPGRLIEEAKWLSKFLGDKQISVCIFHLYISLEEVLKRAETRYYIADSKKPYSSYQEAKKDCKNNDEPYRRHEDEDVEGTKQRYRMLYSENFASIISIYQLNSQSLVFTLDGKKNISEVSQDIKSYFEKFYFYDL